MLERLSESLDAQGRIREVNGRPHAFVGLERDGGSNPATGVLLIVSNEASSTTTIWKLD